jgi:hypothetical protein
VFSVAHGQQKIRLDINEQFEKHNKQDDADGGYGEWLKSDEGVFQTNSVSPSMMHEEFEKQKKKIPSVFPSFGKRRSPKSTFGKG